MRIQSRGSKHTSYRRTAEIDTDSRLHAALEAIDVRAVQDTLSHAVEYPREVGAPEVGAGLELGQGVVVGADAVEDDVLRRVHVELLREERVDLEELDAVASGDARRLVALAFQRGQQRLEPLERARVLAHPDELHAAEAARRVRAVAQVPDVLEDGRPRRDADAGADEDGDLVLEHVFGGGAVGAVDSEEGHLLAVLEGDLVHAHRVDAFVEFRLGATRTDGVTECAGEVADLSDVHGDVRVVGAGRDGERVPLVAGD